MKKSIIAIAIAAVASTAYADNTAVGKYNVVYGDQITVSGNGITAVGTNNFVEGNSSTAVGIHNSVSGDVSFAYGHNAIVEGNESLAVGHKPLVKGGMSIGIGNESTVLSKSGTAVGKGTYIGENADAATVVGSHASARGATAVAVGQHANANGGQSVAIGQSSRADGDQSIAIGSGSSSSARFTTSLGVNAKATNNHDVAIGSFSTTEKAVGTATSEVNGITYGTFKGHKPVATVSVGKEGNERTITNVAAGRITKESTDAVNGSQLYAVANKVGDNAKAIETLKDGVATNADNIAINSNRITTNSQAIQTINNSLNQYNTWNEAQDDQINELRKLVNGLQGDNAELRKEIHDNRREARAGIAGSNAIAAIPQPHAPGQTAIGVGAGYFKNEGAAAIGVSHISNSGRWVSKGGINFDTRRNVGIGLGLSYVFGGVKQQPQVVTKEVVHEVVREVVVREVPAQPVTKKIRG